MRRPTFDQIKQLEERALDGDPRALTELSRLANTLKNDDEIFTAVEAFDGAAVFYAMGKGGDLENEWPKFKAIARKYNEMSFHQREMERCEEGKKRVAFDTQVIERMESTDESVRSMIAEEREAAPYAMPFFDSDFEASRAKAAFCSAWIDAAKSLLASPRFRKLSDDMLNELIEVVAYELEESQRDDEDEDDDSDGADEHAEPSGWLFDDCAICQGAKQAEEEGRNLDESELRRLFDEQNRKNRGE